MPKSTRPVPDPLAYSYLRFSTPEQAKGDSLRRQEERRDAWLERNRAKLDTSLTLADRGVSAFTGEHRKNPDRHALAAFLELARAGRIPRGSFLIVENLDRLSREDIRPALTLLLNLIYAGVRVVQLLPAEQVFDEKVEPMQLMMAIMELSRGHNESRMKSERVGDAWREKKRLAAESRVPLTKTVPAWLELRGGKVVVKPREAEAVRLVYRLAAEGVSLHGIVRKLNREKVKPIGTGAHWSESYVSKFLKSRAAVGEFQPSRWVGGKPKPDGEPIPGYFPAVITDEQWHAVRAGINRRGRPGRGEKPVNIFGGLLTNARTGGPLHVGKRTGVQYLINYHGRIGRDPGTGRGVGFPFAVFAEAVLSQLREIDPREILPDPDEGTDRVMTITGKRDAVRGRIAKLQAALDEDEDEVRSVVEKLRRWEAEEDALTAELARGEPGGGVPTGTRLGRGEDSGRCAEVGARPRPRRGCGCGRRSGGSSPASCACSSPAGSTGWPRCSSGSRAAATAII
jgi:DNA invertase Pin-like site-specific DNA recombinase